MFLTHLIKLIFAIFALLVTLLIGLFGMILFARLAQKNETYSVPKDSFGYDMYNDYFTIESLNVRQCLYKHFCLFYKFLIHA